MTILLQGLGVLAILMAITIATGAFGGADRKTSTDGLALAWLFLVLGVPPILFPAFLPETVFGRFLFSGLAGAFALATVSGFARTKVGPKTVQAVVGSLGVLAALACLFATAPTTPGP